ncbi:poly(3-hydroxybutyrate) depolymerase [Bradyrhizobium japonicum]
MSIAEFTPAPARLDRRRLILGLSGMAVAAAPQAASAKSQAGAQGGGYPVVHHRTTTVDGIRIFYREAGPKDAPAVLLLHGFPTSSHMFRNLIPALADRYHVIAPDYPGYGQSDMPPRARRSSTRSTVSVSSSTACSISSASPAMRCMSWITALPWAGGWRSSIPSASAA